MGGEPLGRPKTLVRRHVLEIKEDTRDWLEEQIDGLKGAFLAGKGIGATGEALEGFLSNPMGALLLGGGVLAAISAWVGADGVQVVMDFFTSLQGLMGAEQGGPEQREAADSFIQAQKALLEFFSGGVLNPFLDRLTQPGEPPPSGGGGGGGGSG